MSPKRRVKSALRGPKGWTLLLECGHTLYDVRAKQRPKIAACSLCERENR